MLVVHIHRLWLFENVLELSPRFLLDMVYNLNVIFIFLFMLQSI